MKKNNNWYIYKFERGTINCVGRLDKRNIQIQENKYGKLIRMDISKQPVW